MEEEQVIEVYIIGIDEIRNTYLADYKGKTIVVDPFVTGLMEDYEDILEGHVQLTGEWDEDCFLPVRYERISK